MSTHEDYMRQAIRVAQCNPRAPFGTILVDNATTEIVTEGLNRSRSNPIMHGEIDAIMRYAEIGLDRWQNLKLYTTAEPCCMCQAAILWAGIPEVVFGTSIAKLVDLGWRQFNMTAHTVATNAPFARCEIISGVLETECDELFRQARKQ